jgi:hypothetical protein
MTATDRRVQAWLDLAIAKNRANLTMDRRKRPKADRTKWLAEVLELEKLAEQQPK